nr:contractile injection system protein, VgrG/Pvc8 family [Escherichia coli]
MLYSMKVHPPLRRAGLRQNFRIFRTGHQKNPRHDVAGKLGDRMCFRCASEPHPSREFCVQWVRLITISQCRMAAEEGIFFYEEPCLQKYRPGTVLCDTVRHLPEF